MRWSLFEIKTQLILALVRSARLSCFQLSQCLEISSVVSVRNVLCRAVAAKELRDSRVMRNLS